MKYFCLSLRLKLIFIFTCISVAGYAQNLSELAVFDGNYPKAIYFRNVENSAADENISYQDWAKRWSKLDGMVVKALDEEIPGRSGVAQHKFIQYKKDNPTKLMLLHFNGNARDPRFDPQAFMATDWTYFVGTYATQDIPLMTKDTEIFVRNTEVFRVKQGSKTAYNDDIAIVPMTASGKLDWNAAEQVTLLSIHKKEKLIKVRRAQFGTSAKGFSSGLAYLAPHVSQPPAAPYSQQSLWRYNFANWQDGSGIDQRLSDNLMSYLGDTGPLKQFDGIEFDVLADIRGLNHQSRTAPIDYNGDGVASELDSQFQQRYRQGVYQFLAALRDKLGANRLILADGNETNQQRAFGIINGIESETWPSHWDPEIEQWSSGINRHLFWLENSLKPSMSYIKLGELPLKGGGSMKPSDNTRRLRVAAALFMDAVIAPAFRPKGKKLDNWPELSGGAKQYRSWLGQARSSLKYHQFGNEIPLRYKVVSDMAKVTISDDEFHIKKQKDKPLTFSITFDLIRSHDIVLNMVTTATSYAENSNGRVSYISVAPNGDYHQKNMTWSGNDKFNSRFYFKGLGVGLNSLHFGSDAEELVLSKLILTPGVEIVYREFEHGLVVANPFQQPIRIDLKNLTNRRVLKIYNKGGFYDKSFFVAGKDAVFIRLLP